MEFPTTINWTSPFQFKGLLGGIYHFYSNLNRTFYKQLAETLIRRHILWRLIWVCTVCLCPTKRTLGLYVLIQASLKFYFLISQPNICCGYSKICCGYSFGHPKQMLKLMEKKIFLILLLEMLIVYLGVCNCIMRFPTMWYVRPAKAQISLRIHAA